MKFKFSKNYKTISIFSILGLVIFFGFMFITYAQSNQTENNNFKRKTIIIDAGHGGEDGGAVGVDGIVEKDVNLAIALKLKDLLKASGYKITMTRDTDTAIYDDDAKTLREKKRSDLRNRMDIMNKNKESDTLFVSIHQNKFPNEKYFGTQIFYSVNDEKSKDLATKIRESVTGLIQPQNKREIKPANNKIFLLNNAKIPSVIVECGFLSNREEAKKLSDEKYQSQMAFSIFCGITNYLMNN